MLFMSTSTAVVNPATDSAPLCALSSIPLASPLIMLNLFSAKKAEVLKEIEAPSSEHFLVPTKAIFFFIV